jgi:hypothetical protein
MLESDAAVDKTIEVTKIYDSLLDDGDDKNDGLLKSRLVGGERVGGDTSWLNPEPNSNSVHQSLPLLSLPDAAHFPLSSHTKCPCLSHRHASHHHALFRMLYRLHCALTHSNRHAIKH